jgi:hypothetical protein
MEKRELVDIETTSRTWKTVQEWATRQLQDAVSSCQRHGLGVEGTEYARGKVAILQSLLKLPEPPDTPEPSTAGMSGGRDLMGGTD